MRSVIIASYNGEKYIQAQLKSILKQLDKKDEIIISDSSSSDKTLQIIKELYDDRIKIYNFVPPILKNNEFQIINKIRLSFINGLKLAKGDIIYLSDQDDVWEDNKVEVCEKELIGNDRCLIVHSCSIIDCKERIILDNTYGVYSKPEISLKQSLINSPFQGCCMVFSKSLLEEILKNSKLLETVELSHDHAISLIAMTKFRKDRMKIINIPLLKYRRHGNNVSTSAEESSHSLSFKVRYRINEILLYLKLKHRN